MSKNLYVMHGLPGSGKSFKGQMILKEAAQNKEKSALVSADKFWGMDYKWNPKFIADAHKWCQGQCAFFMFNEYEHVVVDNTSLTTWECKPYYEMAKRYDYNFSILEPDTTWALDPVECSKRNTHSVPLETIQKMLNKKMSVSDIMGELECTA